jgi:hypothetical protein
MLWEAAEVPGTQAPSTAARIISALLRCQKVTAIKRPFICRRVHSHGRNEGFGLFHSINNTVLTAGLRFNEPLPLGFHNTMSLGYVRTSLSNDRPETLNRFQSKYRFVRRLNHSAPNRQHRFSGR